MARSDLIRRLFTAYSTSDDHAFQQAARETVADERRKNHRLLGSDLEHALDRDLKPGAATALSLRPLPKSRDDRPLLSLTKPRRELADLVVVPLYASCWSTWQQRITRARC